ncbi:riboflavin biosynthesis protein RibF [Phorcysia thermohydrogeniphila]|uniref:Riboflavin biosynthesis protein n=1 Tax=Phorcysia thermohydrogeniphila TaxID=936138 RepID=A0A4V2PD20_9BACT|nr:riboflavin biosynthesis protein RibF [Phorcysia thermohydrogeniphila]TCK03466.1 riboflavin kinase/FMN adenylyltransferase [Phorcysia thermohydrogeniphila]
MEQAQLQESQKRCCIVGKFETFHRGHRKLIERAKELCDKVLIVSIKKEKFTVFSEEERKEIAKGLSVELLNLPFSAVRELSPQEFFQFLKRNGCQVLIVGEDWRFGKDRKGNVRTAKELGEKFGIEVITVQTEKANGEKIATSRIKELLKEGKVEEANKLLGFSYFCLGTVTPGDRLGRDLGYPTLNVHPQKEILLPNGVYEVALTLDGETLRGIANLGVRPTVSNGVERRLEVHVPDRELPELYGKKVKVEFIRFIRPEKRFNSIEELKKQIKFDVENLKRYWRDNVGRAAEV